MQLKLINLLRAQGIAPALRSRYLLGLAVFAALLLGSTRPAFSAAAPVIPDESVWYGIQLADQQVGTTHVTITNASFEGKPAVIEESDMTTGLTILGVTVSQTVHSSTYAQPDGKTPIYETMDMSSGGATTSVTARFYPDHIAATLTSGGDTTPKTIPIPSGVTVSAMDADEGPIGTVLKKGDVVKETTFNPVALTLDPVTISVIDTGRTSTDDLVGAVKNLTVCEVDTPQGDATVYQTSDGTPVRVEFIAGLVMIRQPAPGQSPVPAVTSPTPPTTITSEPKKYVPPADYAVATAVVQRGQPIARPRQCQYLKASIKRNGRQPGIIVMHATTDPESADGTLASAAANPLLAVYTSDAPYLSLDSPQVRNQAKEVAGSETNLATLVCKLHDWVNVHMTPGFSMGLPRAAVSVLGDPQGVCRDYAILYTALARAAGVPTKVCGGIVAFEGRFYYHAWAESYIGKVGGWVAVDPTVPGRFVDATHIALTMGDPSSMYNLTGDVGTVKVTVLQVTY
jgi:transglutaminase-like putative cysteine protease